MNTQSQEHWKWRDDMVQAMVRTLDMERLGVKALYLIGSVKTGNPGPCSDIDLLAHCEKDKEKQALLKAWCEGWGLCLTEINNKNTCFETKGSMIDLHIITDQDIKNKTSFAAMLDSVSNSAKLLKKASVHE